jgi:hypothetical protein
VNAALEMIDPRLSPLPLGCRNIVGGWPGNSLRMLLEGISAKRR